MPVVPVRKQWMIKWGSDERDARESSLEPGKRLGGGKVAVRNETGRHET